MQYPGPSLSPERAHWLTTQVRRDILRMVTAVNSGHPGGSLGCTEYFVALFQEVLRHNPTEWSITGEGQDIFVLSNGHISPVYYSVLARTGYFPVSELATFRKLDSRLQGHPATKEHLPGIHIASGSLGQGISVALGAAIAKKMAGDPNLVYCLCGDGELNEGQPWEAAMFAAHRKADNLILTVDWNRKQIDGDTRQVLDTGDLVQKFDAFGWSTLHVPQAQANDYTAVRAALLDARDRLARHGRPVAILLETTMGFGVDFMADKYQWHGKAPNAEQFATAMAQLTLAAPEDY